MRKKEMALLIPLLLLGGINAASCKKDPIAVDVEAKEVSLNITNRILHVGEVFTLVANVLPENTTNEEITWSSDNSEVATVDNGTVTTVGVGSTTISAKTSNELVASCSLTVKEAITYEMPEAYGDYYSDLTSWTDGNDLRAKLKNIMSTNYVMNTYSNPTNWTTNTKADLALDNHSKVDVVYSNVDEWKEDNGSKTGGWQREHAFCASLMTGVMTGSAVLLKGRATDFHNLWASNQTGNSSRGNMNLGYVADDELSDSKATVGDCRRSSDSLNTFEPSNKDKGRLARSIFYIATMYDDNSLDLTPNAGKSISTGNGTNKKTYTAEQIFASGVTLKEENAAAYSFAHGNLSDLLAFNTFNVDRLEYQHMAYVSTEQHNRNVFVDYPELAEYAFGSLKDQPGQLKFVRPSALDLKLDEGGIANYAVDNVDHSFKVGEKFTTNSFSVVAVNNDYSETAVDVANYTCSLDYDYTFTTEDIGTKEITVTVGEQVIKYNVTVEKADALANCNWNVFFSKTVKPSITAGTTTLNTLNGLKMNLSMTSATTDAPTVGSYSDGKGYQIGTGTKYASNITFETVDKLSEVDNVYIALDTASGCSATLKIYCDDVQISGSINVTYFSTGSQNYGITLDTPVSGTIKLEITNISKAIYVNAIGINYNGLVTE